MPRRQPVAGAAGACRRSLYGSLSARARGCRARAALLLLLLLLQQPPPLSSKAAAAAVALAGGQAG
jgi:hypothetical protein